MKIPGPTIALMCVLLSSYQLANYGMTLWVLKNSKGLRSDLLWMTVVLSLPLGLAEFVWLQGWRVGEQAKLPMFGILVISLTCSLLGSAVAVKVFSGETLSWGSFVGLAFAAIGSFIAIVSR
jgi:hypothetical protein